MKEGICGILRVVIFETGEVFGQLRHGQTCGARPVNCQRFIVFIEKNTMGLLTASDQCAKGWVNQGSRHSGVCIKVLCTLFEYANTHDSPHDSCCMPWRFSEHTLVFDLP